MKKELQGAIEKAKTTLVENKLLNETKQRMRYSFAMSTDSPDVIANSLAAYVANR
ncbi:MAG: hypothetical protein IPP71_17335 [Bacteroidetes bacterium]|nr:hypothetical protein [Bacteroidota bacterium]